MLLACVITPGINYLALGQIHRFPKMVLMLVARVGRLERVGAGIHFRIRSTMFPAPRRGRAALR